jgi:hypothetical protein
MNICTLQRDDAVALDAEKLQVCVRLPGVAFRLVEV